jgi:hypothetical protein
VLLSGVGRATTSKSWTDADGDKVVAKIVGKGSQIQVDVGDGKFIDAANINIVGADYGALSVVVSPVGKMTSPVTTKTIWNPYFNADGITTLDLGKADNLGQKIQTQWYNLTPGFTNIGSITAEDSKAFGYTAPDAIASINLSAVVVPTIDLGDAAVGNINLSTGRVAMVDNLMLSNQDTSFLQWEPGLDGIDFFNIKAGSIDQINLASQVDSNNDFLGTIELTTGGLNRLTGNHSTFQGDIFFSGKTGSLGSVFLGDGWGDDASINALGDLTFLADGFGGVITVGGHLNVQFRGGVDAVIIADGGVSGLRASTTDTIIIQDNFSGQLVSKGDIADIVFEDGGLFNATIEGKNIGTIRFDETTYSSNSSVIATGDIDGLILRNSSLWLAQGSEYSHLLVSAANVGSIDVANGSIFGAMAVGEIGAVTLRGGSLVATLVATTGDIGAVNIELGNLGGRLIAQAGNIGNVTVLSNGGAPAIYGDIIAGAGSIGTIDASNVGGGQAIGGDAVIFAKTDITAINASTTGDTAIGSATITAQGSLGPVEAIAYGTGGGGAIDGLTLVAPTIGAITGTSISGIGIANSNFIATTGAVANISGTGKTGGLDNVTVNAATSIGNIFGNATVSGDGIADSDFVAQNGTIGSVTGKTSGPFGDDGIHQTNISASGDIGAVTGTAFGGYGIFESNITSLAGNIGAVSGSSSEVGGSGYGIYTAEITALAGKITSITGTSAGSGDGIFDVTGNALTGIGTIKGTSVFGNGINESDFTVSGPGANIDAVIGETSEGVAIRNSGFTAIGGTISTITASPTGVGGDAIDNSSFTAATLGALTVNVTNLAGGFAINKSIFTATQGDLGAITVNNDSLANAASGITNSTFTSNKGNIGSLTVTTDGANVSDGVSGSAFFAAGNIAAISVTTTGNNSYGIDSGSIFIADNDGSGAGDIASITVKIDGAAGSRGISGATFAAENIGALTVDVTNLGGGNGITEATFTAANDMKAINVTTNGNNARAIDFNIAGGIFVGNDLTSLTAKVTNEDGGAVFVGQGKATTVVEVDGNMGDLTITNASTLVAGNGLENVKIDVVGTLGAVAITTVGGTGMVNSSIDPTTIASVAITSANADTKANEVAMDNSEILASVSIGNVTITGNVNGTSRIATQDLTLGDKTATTIGTVGITGDFTGTLSAGTTIGAVTVSGDASGAIYSGQVAAGNVTSVTAKTVNSLVVVGGSSATNTGTVGNITITGDNGINPTQELFVNAFASVDGKTGGTIGAISAALITTDNAELQVTVYGDALSVGAITVDNADAGETADLDLVLGAKAATLSTITVDGDATLFNGGALATIGVVSIGGDATLATSFNTVKTASTFGANKVLGGQTFGTGAAGSTIGLITINDGAVAANSATFTFATMNGKTNATADATLAVDFLTGAGPDITTLQAKTPGTTVAGITAILV